MLIFTHRPWHQVKHFSLCLSHCLEQFLWSKKKVVPKRINWQRKITLLDQCNSIIDCPVNSTKLQQDPPWGLGLTGLPVCRKFYFKFADSWSLVQPREKPNNDSFNKCEEKWRIGKKKASPSPTGSSKLVKILSDTTQQNAVESRFLEPSVSRTSGYLDPNLVSLGFTSLDLYNFTPDFSNPLFSRNSR